MKIINAACILYLSMFIFTFGHCYTVYPQTFYEFGVPESSRINKYSVVDTMFGAFFSSILWPLYWSVQIQIKD